MFSRHLQAEGKAGDGGRLPRKYEHVMEPLARGIADIRHQHGTVLSVHLTWGGVFVQWTLLSKAAFSSSVPLRNHVRSGKLVKGVKNKLDQLIAPSLGQMGIQWRGGTQLSCVFGGTHEVKYEKTRQTQRPLRSTMGKVYSDVARLLPETADCKTRGEGCPPPCIVGMLLSHIAEL